MNNVKILGAPHSIIKSLDPSLTLLNISAPLYRVPTFLEHLPANNTGCQCARRSGTFMKMLCECGALEVADRAQGLTRRT